MPCSVRKSFEELREITQIHTGGANESINLAADDVFSGNHRDASLFPVPRGLQKNIKG